MKILILGGFLGSGKTSVLLRLAKQFVGEGSDNAAKIVIIENEIGEVGVDDKMLNAGGYKVENMFSGCICCSMAGDIVVNLQKIEKDFHPELVIIESSGVGYPFNIKENIVRILNLDCTICTVVDSKRWKRMLIPMQMMLNDQLRDSDYILVNKIDLVDQEMLDFVDESVKGFVPTAKICNISATTAFDSALIDEILG